MIQVLYNTNYIYFLNLKKSKKKYFLNINSIIYRILCFFPIGRINLILLLYDKMIEIQKEYIILFNFQL